MDEAQQGPGGSRGPDLRDGLRRLSDLIAIRSISTDPAYRPDCERAAHWLHDLLAGMGFSGRVEETEGLPVLLMTRRAPGGERRPHVLFYAHYDVQPAGKDGAWHSPPFEMELRDGSIHGRGASDNKGQMMTFVEALRRLHREETLDLDVTVLIEGEEEIGSPSLPGFLRRHPELSEVDVIYVCDTSMWDAETPAICLRLRGLVSEEVEIRVAHHDRHSGAFGGVAPNAAQVLSGLLAGLKDGQGRVTLPGFYEAVVPPGDDELACWAALDMDLAPFAGLPDADDPAALLRKLWAEPSMDISGIACGYGGAGFKTIVPAVARAKIGFRLVAGQCPDQIRTVLRRYVSEAVPEGAEVRFVTHNATPPCVIADQAPGLAQTVAALNAVWPKPTVLIGGAGTIPVAGLFQEILGKAPLLVGFGLADDGAHGPDEHYSLASFAGGIRSWVHILTELQSGELS